MTRRPGNDRLGELRHARVAGVFLLEGRDVDPQFVLSHVDTWPVDDRLRLMEEIWDGLLRQGHEPGLTEAQKAEIDARLAEDDAEPDDVVSWDEVKADALKRAGR